MKLNRIVAVVFALALLLSPLARAQAIKQLSGEPLVLIRVNNLAAVNAKWGALATKLGLGALNPAVADPLALAQQSLQIKEGLDTKSEAVVAVYAPAMNSPEPTVLALLPVTDYKAFLGNMPNVQKDGDLDTFLLPTGNAVYATQRGSFAAFSNTKELLAQPVAAVELKGLAGRLWAERDVVFWVNMKAVGQMALPQFRMLRGIMQNNPAMANMPGMNPRQAAFGAAMLKQMMDLMERFLTDGTGLTYALSIAPEGVSLTEEVDFAEGSAAAQWLAGVKNTEEPLLKGLPADPFLLAGGWVQGGGGMWDMFETVYLPAFKAMNLPEEQDKAIQQWAEAAKATILALRGGSFSIQTPPQQPGEGGLMRGSTIMRGDIKVMMANVKTTIEHQKDFQEAMGQAMTGDVAITPGARTVEGVKFDEYKMALDFQQTGQPPQMVKLMQSMLGQSMTSYIGAIDDNTLVSAINLDESQMGRAVAAAKAGTSPLNDDPRVKAVSARLPKSRTAEMYLSPGPLLNLILDAAAAAGEKVPAKVPADLPPIGMSMGTEGSAVRFDLAVPVEVIEAGVSLGMQASTIENQRNAPAGGL